MLIDTHCHLNFQAFAGREGEVIARARERGVGQFVVPGTDLATSQKAVELASIYPEVYAAVGIHPHHVSYHPGGDMEQWEAVKALISQPKVVAVGEVGIDKYEYQTTKYPNYQVTPEFVSAQEQLLRAQIKLAIAYDKALILHNRLAVAEILKILSENWDEKLEGRAVFHCCEAEVALLEFAKSHRMYLGVDGDITWSKKKQRFIKEVPLSMLVLETDSPYLTPEPAKLISKTNEPQNLLFVRDQVALLQAVSSEKVAATTTQNAHQLFNLG